MARLSRMAGLSEPWNVTWETDYLVGGEQHLGALN